jgi:hypothetical protein
VISPRAMGLNEPPPLGVCCGEVVPCLCEADSSLRYVFVIFGRYWRSEIDCMLLHRFVSHGLIKETES